MSAERIFEDYLEDILEYAEKAVLFLEKTPTVDDLQKDERTLLAVVRALEVVGEAFGVNRLVFRSCFLRGLAISKTGVPIVSMQETSIRSLGSTALVIWCVSPDLSRAF